jgi:hypothetical protein
MNQSIFPGVEWKDTDGNKIEAHGGTMFIEKNTYYWIGEDKSHTDGKKLCLDMGCQSVLVTGSV